MIVITISYPRSGMIKFKTGYPRNNIPIKGVVFQLGGKGVKEHPLLIGASFQGPTRANGLQSCIVRGKEAQK